MTVARERFLHGQDCTPPVDYMTPAQLGWVPQPPARAWRELEKREAEKRRRREERKP